MASPPPLALPPERLSLDLVRTSQADGPEFVRVVSLAVDPPGRVPVWVADLSDRQRAAVFFTDQGLVPVPEPQHVVAGRSHSGGFSRPSWVQASDMAARSSLIGVMSAGNENVLLVGRSLRS